MGLFSKKQSAASEKVSPQSQRIAVASPYRTNPHSDQHRRRHSAVEAPPQEYYQPRARFLSLPTDRLPHIEENSYSHVNRTLRPQPHIPPPHYKIPPFYPHGFNPKSSGSYPHNRRTLPAAPQVSNTRQPLKLGQPLYPPNPNLKDIGLPSAPEFPFMARKKVLQTLETVLAMQNTSIQHCIDLDDYYHGAIWSEAGRPDGLKIVANDGSVQSRLHIAERNHYETERQKVVFGNYLGNVYKHNASPVNVYGYRHMVPSVLKACVEAMAASELKYSELFESHVVADQTEVNMLVKHFNKLHPAHRHHSLTSTPIEVVVALFSYYIQELGDSPFPRPIVDALHAWCDKPSAQRYDEHKYTYRARMVRPEDGGARSASDDSDHESEIELNSQGLPSFHSKRKREEQRARRERRVDREEENAHDSGKYYARHDEARRIRQHQRKQLDAALWRSDRDNVHVARLIILSMPEHHLSFVVYLFTFFASLKASTELGDRFGKKLFAGISCAPQVMTWLLDRWDWIAEGLKSETARASTDNSAYKRSKVSRTPATKPPEQTMAPMRSSQTATQITSSQFAHQQSAAAGSMALSPRDPIVEEIDAIQRELERPLKELRSRDAFDTQPLSPTNDLPLETGEDIPVIVPYNDSGYFSDSSRKSNPLTVRNYADTDAVTPIQEIAPTRQPFNAVEALCQIPPPPSPTFDGPQAVLDIVGAFDEEYDMADEASVYSQVDEPPSLHPERLEGDRTDDIFTAEPSDDPAVLKQQLAAAMKMLEQMRSVY